MGKYLSGKEKEIKETQKHIEKIWGKNLKMKKSKSGELKKLGEDLGINLYGRKRFYTPGDKLTFKTYNRTCDRCDSSHKVRRQKGMRPRSGLLCDKCRRKKYDEMSIKRKTKNFKKWDNLILDLLQDGEINISDAAKKLERCRWSISKTFKRLEKNKQIIFINKGGRGNPVIAKIKY